MSAGVSAASADSKAHTEISAEQFFSLCFWDWAINEKSKSLNQQLRAAFGVVRLPNDASVANAWQVLFKFGRVSVEEVTQALKARQLKKFFIKELLKHSESTAGVCPALGPIQMLLRTRPNVEQQITFENSCPLAPIAVPTDDLNGLISRYNIYKTSILQKSLKMLELLQHTGDDEKAKKFDIYVAAIRAVGGEGYPVVVPKVAQDLLHDVFKKVAELEMVDLDAPLDALDTLNRARRYVDVEDQESLKTLDALRSRAEEAWKKLQLQNKTDDATSSSSSAVAVAAVVVHPHESGMPERLEEISFRSNKKLCFGRRPRKSALMSAASGRDYFVVKAPTELSAAKGGPNLLATRLDIEQRSGLASLFTMHQDLGSVVIFRRDNGNGHETVRATEVKAIHEFLAELTALYAEKDKAPPKDKEELQRFFERWVKEKDIQW